MNLLYAICFLCRIINMNNKENQPLSVVGAIFYQKSRGNHSREHLSSSRLGIWRHLELNAGLSWCQKYTGIPLTVSLRGDTWNWPTAAYTVFLCFTPLLRHTRLSKLFVFLCPLCLSLPLFLCWETRDNTPWPILAIVRCILEVFSWTFACHWWSELILVYT